MRELDKNKKNSEKIVRKKDEEAGSGSYRRPFFPLSCYHIFFLSFFLFQIAGTFISMQIREKRKISESLSAKNAHLIILFVETRIFAGTRYTYYSSLRLRARFKKRITKKCALKLAQRRKFRDSCIGPKKYYYLSYNQMLFYGDSSIDH